MSSFACDPVSGLDRELEDRRLDRHIGEEPLVRDVDDVAADFTDDRRDLAQRAGNVTDLDAQAREPAAADKAP